MLIGAASSLGGCGFAPLYRRNAAGQPGAVARELGAVSVDVISDRPGQLLHQALQERLGWAGTSVAQRYALSVDYSIAGEGIGIRQDNTVTRVRLLARARWVLRAEDAARTPLTSDSVRSVDDFNVLNQQFFASDLDGEAARRRLAETLADQIVLQLASYFRRRSAPTIAAG